MSTFGLPWVVATRKRSICSSPKMLKCFQFRMWLAVQFWFWVAKWISCQNMFTEWSLEWNAAKVINHVFLLFEFKSECYFEHTRTFLEWFYELLFSAIHNLLFAYADLPLSLWQACHFATRPVIFALIQSKSI